MNSDLTYREAVASWIGRELGWKIRDIQSKYDVDPRRLYEAWEGLTHHGSRDDAIRLFAVLFPSSTPKFGFALHEPKFCRTGLDQLEFFK